RGNRDLMTAPFSSDWEGFDGLRRLRSTRFKSGYFPPPRLSVEVRLYFGVSGCIVPIAWMPNTDETIVVFAIAGPCNSEGKKALYMINLSPIQNQDILEGFPMKLSGLSDFHAHFMILDPEMINITTTERRAKFRTVDGRLRSRVGWNPETNYPRPRTAGGILRKFLRSIPAGF
ncbi:hypothetical protein B0H13DRAFT_2016401, partial [Mycena leptocephala]